MNKSSQTQNENWRPLALMLVGVAVALVIIFRLMPYGIRGYNFAPAGALFLFVGARLRPSVWYLLPFGVSAGIDLYFYQEKGWPFPLWSYPCYTIYLLLGWLLLRKSESLFRTGLVAWTGSLLFFLITNFAVWLQHVMKPELYVGAPFQFPPTLAGLMQCYEVALPFFQGTFISDMIFSIAFFGSYAWLARTCFPAERIAPATTSEANS